MPADKQKFISWLSSLYATITSQSTQLAQHADEAKQQPEIADKLQDHLKHSSFQAEALEKLIQQNGGSISPILKGTATAVGALDGAVDTLADDAVLRNLLEDYSAEYLEIGYLRLLIAASTEYGEQEILNVCQDILREDEEMANWLEERIPDTVRSYLATQSQ